MANAVPFLLADGGLQKFLAPLVGAFLAPVFDGADRLEQAGDYATLQQRIDQLDVAAALAPYEQALLFYTIAPAAVGARTAGGNPPLTVLMPGLRTAVQLLVRALAATIKRELTNALLQAQGLPKQKADNTRLVRPFQSFQPGVEKSAMMVSSLHTTRLAAFGFTAEADVLGIEVYAINAQLDALTCPVCSLMHGKTFNVQQARTMLVTLMQIDDPEQMKYIAPWPKQDKQSVDTLSKMTPAQLVANYWNIPPFHPWCRCQLSKVAEVPAIGTVELPDYQATADDFELVGQTATPAEVETWNKVIGTHPADMASAVTGKAAVEMVEEALNGNKKAFQIDAIKETGSGGISVKASGTLHGATNASASFTVDSLGVVSQVEVQLPAGAYNAGTSFVKSFIPYLSSSKVNSLMLENYVAVEAWLKMGFVPVDVAGATAQVQQNLIAYVAEKAVSDTLVVAIRKILASNHPTAFWAIADLSVPELPDLAESLLVGVAGALSFDFNNPDAIQRFQGAMQ